MLEGLRKLYTGDFNRRVIRLNSDGSKTITLSKRGENKSYVLTIKDLYGKDEKVLNHKVIDTKKALEEKPWIAERMKQAKAEKEKANKKKEKHG